MPEKVYHFHRKRKISEMFFCKGGKLMGRESVFERRRKEVIFIRAVNLSEMEQQIFEINPDSGLFFEKRTNIKTDSHLD